MPFKNECLEHSYLINFKSWKNLNCIYSSTTITHGIPLALCPMVPLNQICKLYDM
uniref:Uncharacterized protein n=1 Tax=Anguilla anguilla TaxID=7936 RepID=A0A0E9S0X7_ANGAN